MTYTEVDRANARIRPVTSLYCQDIDVMLEQRLTFHLKGWLRYEKPNKFRLSCGIRGRTECDIGSNEKDFWFWSRRMKPSALFYCDHEHILATRLRTPLNPLWMMECIGLGEVKSSGIRAAQTGTGLMIYETRMATMGHTVTKTTMLERGTHLISGHALLDQKSAIIASSRVMDWQTVDGLSVPKTVEMVWHEENIRITLRLNDPRINCTILKQDWQMPDIQPRIYMPTY